MGFYNTNKESDITRVRKFDSLLHMRQHYYMLYLENYLHQAGQVGGKFLES
jgi:hypothetical protein